MRCVLLFLAVCTACGASKSGSDLFAATGIPPSQNEQDAGTGQEEDAAGEEERPTDDGGVLPEPEDARVDDEPKVPCSACSDTEYCADGKTCVSCSDFSRLHFGPATRLPASDGPGRNQVFARLSDEAPPKLYYEYAPSAHTGIAMASQWQTAQGIGIASSAINTPDDDSAPFYLPAGLSLAGIPIAQSGGLLFDSDRVGPNSERALYFAEGGPTATSVTPLPAPINGGISDFHLTVAYESQPVRAYWSSRRMTSNGTTVSGLFTATSSAQPTRITLTLPGGCPCQSADPEAWISKDGSLLLFDCANRDASDGCAVVDSGRPHLFYARMNVTTGGQIGEAVEIRELNRTGSYDVTPSLSPSGCDIFFSTRASAAADYDVFRAARD